jgi:hypothetical protein
MAGERLKMALRKYQQRYRAASRQERSVILDAFCEVTGYHRKYATALLGRLSDEPGDRPRRQRGPAYSPEAVRVLERIWKAADYPWSVRLKALLPLWLPWAPKDMRGCTPQVESQLVRMSARQMDRRLADKKRKLKRRIYDTAKPPLDRLIDASKSTPHITRLVKRRESTDPFTLFDHIERQLKALEVQRRQKRKQAA